MGKYDEWTCKKLTWTKELCIKLINDVKNHGSAEVARELGYKNSRSLMASLYSYSKSFGVIDIYDEMIGNKKWTKELCIKLINDVKNRGFTEVAREIGYKNSMSLMASLRNRSERFGVIDIYDEMIGRKGKGSN